MKRKLFLSFVVLLFPWIAVASHPQPGEMTMVRLKAHELETATFDAYQTARRFSSVGWREQYALEYMWFLVQAARHFHQQVGSYFNDPEHTEDDYQRLVAAYHDAESTLYDLRAYYYWNFRGQWDAVRNLMADLAFYYGGNGHQEPNELLGFWNFEEGSGTTVADISANQNHGTLINGAFFAPPVPILGSEHAIGLDGYDDYIEIPHSQTLNLTSSFTIEAWVNRQGSWAPQYGYAPIVAKGSLFDNSLNYGLFLRDNSNLGQDQFAIVGFYKDVTGKTGGTDEIQITLPVGVWNHFAVVYDHDARTFSVYQNAQLLNTESLTRGSYGVVGSPQPNSVPLRIGVNASPTHRRFLNAFVDEVQIWNGALTPTKITSQVNALH